MHNLSNLRTISASIVDNVQSGVGPANLIKQRPIREPGREKGVFAELGELFLKKQGGFTKIGAIREFRRVLLVLLVFSGILLMCFSPPHQE